MDAMHDVRHSLVARRRHTHLGMRRALCLLFLAVLATAQEPANNETQLVCQPFGECEPCPDDAVRNPPTSLMERTLITFLICPVSLTSRFANRSATGVSSTVSLLLPTRSWTHRGPPLPSRARSPPGSHAAEYRRSSGTTSTSSSRATFSLLGSGSVCCWSARGGFKRCRRAGWQRG